MSIVVTDATCVTIDGCYCSIIVKLAEIIFAISVMVIYVFSQLVYRCLYSVDVNIALCKIAL